MIWFLVACRPVEWFGDGPAISHVRLDRVPNPLAVRVRFETSEDAVGAVEFGRGEELEWRIEDSGGKEDHDLIVFGLHADEQHRLDIVAEDPRGGVSRTVPQDWETETVLDGLAMQVLADVSPTPGWTLLDLSEDRGLAPARAVMVDEDGQIVWMHTLEDGVDLGAMHASVTPAGAVLMGGSVPVGARPTEVALDGEVLWEGPVQVAYEETGFQHHHLDLLPGRTWIGPEKDFRDGVRGDRVVERNIDGDEVWSWSTWDHWEPEPRDPGNDGEWTHLNWVQLDDDVLWLSDKEHSAIWKVDRGTGESLWQLGKGGDFALTSGTFFRGQHAPEVLPDGRILVYDNGLDLDRSRVVEYTLDEAAMTATETWSFDGGEEWAWFTGWWGDVDVLSDDRLLICAAGSQNRRVMEVTRSGEVVWVAEWPEGFASYRAERVDPERWGWSRLR